MIATVTLVLSLAAVDLRPALVELQLEGRYQEALERVEQELAARPETARQLGLDYLRGHLLELLGREGEAIDAFSAAVAVPRLSLYSRYRLALAYDRTGHPEMAAGLVATGLAQAPGSPLARDAIRLLVRTLARGGDCNVINGIPLARLSVRERRRLQLARADCADRAGQRDRARSLWAGLLEDDRRDEAAREASQRLRGPAATDDRLALLVGLAFHHHREFILALEHLRRGLAGGAGSERERSEALYALARTQFWEGHYFPAATAFGSLAARSTSEERARALYQQGRCYELAGQWQQAGLAFGRAVAASPEGEWAAPSLLSAMRLEWRAGDEATALEHFAALASRPQWREPAAVRAALFLASSDVARRRADRARGWLAVAERGSSVDRLEAAYWRGRVAELLGDRMGAVRAYLEAMRADLYHPLAQSGRNRLAATPLATAAAAEGRRLAGSSSTQDLYGAWLLLGDSQPMGATAHRRLVDKLLADRGAAPYLRLRPVPIRRWPLWDATLDQPEEILLALGLWHEGGPAVLEHFPTSTPSLAFTASQMLARAGEAHRSFYRAGILRDRAPARVPVLLQPITFQKLLYPLHFEELLTAESRTHGVDPLLLAAIIREESRFDPDALSPAAARGLTQFVLPTARRVAGTIKSSVQPDDLYRPEVSIALGAAYLSELLGELDGAPHMAIAAYNAGVPQARLWRSYCYSAEPEEYFTKVSFEESRGYVRKVLTSWAHYRELYGER